MNRILRQTVLGFGTFGTGCALLALSVNPYLLVLTDTVVGVGMLFAAGSVTVNDLPLKRHGTPGDAAAAVPGGAPEAPEEIPSGLKASLGKLKGSLKSPSAVKGKEAQEDRVKEIDRMLDTTLAGQSKRLISLAEGQGGAPGKAATAPAAAAAAPAQAPAATAPGQEDDLLQEFSKTEVGSPFGDAAEPAGGPGLPGLAAPAGLAALVQEARPASTALPGGPAEGAPQANAISFGQEDLGADDLLSALRLEALKEKKKDDTSLVRDLRGVKVTGTQLLDELNSLVSDMRGR